MIVVMEAGVVQQIGKPQSVYDDPVNLFVAKFLGTPAINVFDGTVKNEKLIIGDDTVLDTLGVPDQDVSVGIRPEGFWVDDNGAFKCDVQAVEVMGRDVSIVSTHAGSQSEKIRSIISTEFKMNHDLKQVRFTLKPGKVHIFNKATGERIRF